MTKSIIHEEWRAVVGFEGYYETSNRGQVKSLARERIGSCPYGSFVRQYSERILSQNRLRRGYLGVGLYRDGSETRHLVHRLVLEAFVGPCPDGMECCHYDGDPSNNHVSNLRWGTRAENYADTVRHGTTLRGEDNGYSKLTEFDVIEIRRMYAAGEGSLREIGERFGVGQPIVELPFDEFIVPRVEQQQVG